MLQPLKTQLTLLLKGIVKLPWILSKTPTLSQFFVVLDVHLERNPSAAQTATQSISIAQLTYKQHRIRLNGQTPPPPTRWFLGLTSSSSLCNC